MQSHDTIVIGANKNKEIVFFKSFTYSTEKDAAQLALTHAQTFPIWYISTINLNSWELNRPIEEYTLTFKIPL